MKKSRPTWPSEEWTLILRQNVLAWRPWRTLNGPHLHSHTQTLMRLHSNSPNRDRQLDYMCSRPQPALAIYRGNKLQVYTTIQRHHSANSPPSLRMIVSGTAGTGKSYLIHCLRFSCSTRLSSQPQLVWLPSTLMATPSTHSSPSQPEGTSQTLGRETQ